MILDFNRQVRNLHPLIYGFVADELATLREDYVHARTLGSLLCPNGMWEDLRVDATTDIGKYSAYGSEANKSALPEMNLLTGKIPKFTDSKEIDEEKMIRINQMVGVATKEALAYEYAKYLVMMQDSYYKMNEKGFHEMLSKGKVDVKGKDIDFTIDFQIPTVNKFGVKVANKISYDDVKAIADKKRIRRAFAPQPMIDLMGQDPTFQAKWAMMQGGLANTFALGLQQINEVLRQDFRFEITLVEEFIEETNGEVRTWEEGVVSFVGDERVGVIAHAPTIKNMQGTKDYGSYIVQTLGQYSLTSVMTIHDNPDMVAYRLETRSVPILGNADKTFILNSKIQNV